MTTREQLEALVAKWRRATLDMIPTTELEKMIVHYERLENVAKSLNQCADEIQSILDAMKEKP